MRRLSENSIEDFIATGTQEDACAIIAMALNNVQDHDAIKVIVKWTEHNQSLRDELCIALDSQTETEAAERGESFADQEGES